MNENNNKCLITPLDIKRMRGVMCLTQEEFARKVGTSVDTIKAVECGRVPISVNLCYKLNYLAHTYDFWSCQDELARIVNDLRYYSGGF